MVLAVTTLQPGEEQSGKGIQLDQMTKRVDEQEVETHGVCTSNLTSSSRGRMNYRTSKGASEDSVRSGIGDIYLRSPRDHFQNQLQRKQTYTVLNNSCDYKK